MSWPYTNKSRNDRNRHVHQLSYERQSQHRNHVIVQTSDFLFYRHINACKPIAY